MTKYLISNRKDANCARFYNMCLVFYAANRVGANFGFSWQSVDVGEENDEVYKDFNGQRMLGCKVDDKECYFDEDFLKTHYIDLKAQDESKIWDFSKPYPKPFKSLNDFKDFVRKSEYEFYDLSDANTIDAEAFTGFHPHCIWFYDFFKFAPKINALHQKANELAASFETGGGFVAFHLRCGELYPYNAGFCHPWKNYYFSNIHFLMHFIEKVALKHPIIVFADDVDTSNLMIKKLGLKNVFSVDEFRDFDTFSVGELLMFDLALMSKALEIYSSGSSSVSNLGSLINCAAANLKSIYNLANSKKDYLSIKEKLEKYEFNPYHQSFSYLHLFLLAEKLKIDIKEQRLYLQKAMNLCPKNLKYKLYFAAYLARYNKTQDLEDFLANLEDFEGFLSLLALSFNQSYDKNPAFKATNKRLFVPYFFLANKKYPHIQRAFERLKEVDEQNGGFLNLSFKRRFFRHFLKKLCSFFTPLKKFAF